MSTTSDRMDNVLKELKLPRSYEARRTAKCAHEDHFEDRRGAFEDDGSGTIRLYDNSPYVPRDEQIRQLAAWLADHGHEIVGAASYPSRGESAGYTLGIVVRYRSHLRFDGAHSEICDAWNSIISGVRDRRAASV